MEQGEDVPIPGPPELKAPTLQNGSDDIDQTIRYKVVYRHPRTDKVITTRFTNQLGEENHDEAERHPVFEIVTTYKARIVGLDGSLSSSEDSSDDEDSSFPQRTAFDSPTYHMNIYSPAIINALRSVVKYYPSQDLTGDPVVVHWPYPVLVHHYDELNDFKASCSAKKPEDLCIREKNAPQHITLLLDFLEKNIMEEVRTEQNRNKEGSMTWEYLWVSHKPGTFLTSRHIETGISTSQAGNAAIQVIHSITGGKFGNDRSQWSVQAWNLMFDGKSLRRVKGNFSSLSFDGEIKISEFLQESQISNETLNSLGEATRKLYRHGRQYWNLLRKQCRFYKGQTEEFPFNEVSDIK